MQKKCIPVIIVIFAIFLLMSSISIAAPLKNIPVKVTQPNGEVLELLASGDEFYNYLHDKNGYTIIQNPDNGYYVYAYKKKDRLYPSEILVNSKDPEKFGITPHLLDSYDYYRNRVNAKKRLTKTRTSRVSTTGTINGIVIFIRFNGEAEFVDNMSKYDGMYNTDSNSLKNYYKEVSYNSLTINSTFYPSSTTTVVSYEDSHPRGYYEPYSSENTIGYPVPADEDHMDNLKEVANREQTLIKNAVDYVRSEIPSSLDLDNDNDGFIDAISVIVNGEVGEWAALLWPHKWDMFTQDIYINSAKMDSYSFLLTSPSYLLVGVIAHEMFHALGAPDLYRYFTENQDPVGVWDIMANTTDPPQYMGAYMKYKYGNWIDAIPEITSNGTYTLNSLQSSTNNAYKIKSSQNLNEYFVLEYRKASGTFESGLPNSGLIVTRIKEDESPDGNYDGPPDEVYVFRANGGPSSEGDYNNAYLSSNSGRTSFHSGSNPYPFFSNGNVETTIEISNIGSAGGDSITFKVNQVVSEQCNTCSGSCGEGHACVTYNGTDISICLQECGNGEPCPDGSECYETTAYGFICAPDTVSAKCQDNDVYVTESCGNSILYKECDDTLTACNTETFECDPLYTEDDCDNNIDDDGDGKKDCEDPDCKLLEICGWDGQQCSFCDPYDSSTCANGYSCHYYTDHEDQPWCSLDSCTNDEDCEEGNICHDNNKICVPEAVSVECENNSVYYTNACGYQNLYLECASNTVCNANTASCDSNCTADTCLSLGKECGSWSNGCDSTLNCGTCTDYDNSYCNSGQCDCTVETCLSVGVECGDHDNGCGGTINCGNCDSGYTCKSGQCEFDSVVGSSCNISGYKIVQTESDREYIIPNNTVIENGGFFIVGREMDKATFETTWSTTLNEYTIYENGDNKFPTMNGEETYSLKDKYDNMLDGPTIVMPEDVSIQRISTDYESNNNSAWSSVECSQATPGSTSLVTDKLGVIITEFSDHSENYKAEFIEIYCNTAPADGDADITDGDDTTTDGDDMTEDGDDVTTDGDNVAEDGDDTTTDGDDVTEDGDDVTTDGDNVTEDGDNITEDGDDTITDGDSSGSEGSGSGCNSTDSSPAVIIMLSMLIIALRRKSLIF